MTAFISPNQPLYLYQQPMFSITVAAVLIIDNGVCVVKDEKNGLFKFPGGIVRAGTETIQFAVVKYVKEQTGLILKKDSIIPVDFRSDPERSKEKNVVDIGFLCIPNGITPDSLNKLSLWKEVDFENKCIVDKSIKWYMDHQILLERAIDIMMVYKEEN